MGFSNLKEQYLDYFYKKLIKVEDLEVNELNNMFDMFTKYSIGLTDKYYDIVNYILMKNKILTLVSELENLEG